MPDRRYTATPCECGDAFCAGCEEAEEPLAPKAPEKKEPICPDCGKPCSSEGVDDCQCMKD